MPIDLQINVCPPLIYRHRKLCFHQIIVSASQIIMVKCYFARYIPFTKSALRFPFLLQVGIILVKKSAFNNWSYNRFKLSLIIRL